MRNSTTMLVVSLAFVFAAILSAVSVVPTVYGTSVTKVADPNTVFHRVYVVGGGKDQRTARDPYAMTAEEEEASRLNDINDMRNGIEDPDNEATGSTSQTLEQPTKDGLTSTIDALKATATAGQEVTIVFAGHGSVNEFGLNRGPDGTLGRLTKGEMADLVRGFAPGVTVVVIAASCYSSNWSGPGGIEETDSVAVIGVHGECPVDPIVGYGVTTFLESIEDGVLGPTYYCDLNDDGIVTATELKLCLKERYEFDTGVPPSPEVGRLKRGPALCLDCDGQAPALLPSRAWVRVGSTFIFEGTGFQVGSPVGLRLALPDGTERSAGASTAGEDGSLFAPGEPGWRPTGELRLVGARRRRF